MGGYGSGKTGRTRKAESCYSLGVTTLTRAGALQPGWAGNWQWTHDGAKTAEIGMTAQANNIKLTYRLKIEGDWEDITQTVGIIRTPCHYGGTRPYFQCPGVVNGRECSRRVGKLFKGGRYFLCRHCYDVAYTSQSETRSNRMLRRANKRRKALGGKAGMAHWLAPKPKGMWQRTYDRHRAEIDWCEYQSNILFLARYRHLMPCDEIEMYFGK